MPKIFGATVCFVMIVGFAAYYSNRGPDFSPEVTLAWCGFEEAAANTRPSYCDLGYTCYNSTQQLEQADHETEATIEFIPDKWIDQSELGFRTYFVNTSATVARRGFLQSCASAGYVPPPPTPQRPTPPPPPTPSPPPGSRCARAPPCPPPSSDCKQSGTCMEANGNCSVETNQPAGTTCDDGNPATSNDVCEAGICYGTLPPPPAPVAAYTPAACSDASQVAIAVRIVVSDQYSDEIKWDMDGGSQFPTTPYADNSDTYQDFCLPVGDHTINYIDSYGDGWGTGYWTVVDSAGAIIAGGDPEGIVTGAGGEMRFSLQAGGGGVAAAEGSVTVTVVAVGAYANEYTWNIDGGSAFPNPAGSYVDGITYAETLSLPEGRHSIYYIDTYGDGWSGGYWEIDAGNVRLAGGPNEGLVDGAGGEQVRSKGPPFHLLLARLWITLGLFCLTLGRGIAGLLCYLL